MEADAEIIISSPRLRRDKAQKVIDLTKSCMERDCMAWRNEPAGKAGCPKLDDVDYTEKLTQIISENDIKSVTVVRMEVPCCGGLQMAAQNALKASGKFLPWRVVTISTDGEIIDD